MRFGVRIAKRSTGTGVLRGAGPGVKVRKRNYCEACLPSLHIAAWGHLGSPPNRDLSMRDPRLDRLADVMVRYCTVVKPGHLVTIVGEPGAMDGVEALFEAVLRAGAHPSYHAKCQDLQELMLRHGSDEQVRHVCPFERYRLEKCDVLFVLACPRNTRSMGAIDPKRSAMAQAARREVLTMSLRRLAEGATQYCLTEIPGEAAAQDAEMSLKDYAERVFRAGMLHLEDPVGAWMRLRGQSERALEYLRQRKEIRLRSPASDGSVDRRKHEGTDVTVNVEGRGWNNHSGATNFPDGEIDTGPREVDGVVNFTFPAIFKGREVDGIRLKYRAGKVVEASAVKNEAYLIALLEQDEGASTVGELGIGTNYELPDMLRNAFFDEKIGGTFHIAVGAGYPETGNTNQSGLHWDMVSDLRRGGTMHADGELVQENGRFLKEGWPGV